VTFKDKHPEIQHLVKELVLLRRHNHQFREGDPQDTLLLFAEGAVALVLIERFVRAVLGVRASEGDTLYNLLQKAVKDDLLTLPFHSQEEGIRRIRTVRNTIQHGNYEQAAAQAGCDSVAAYFKTQFASEVEQLGRIAEHLIEQVDNRTGKRV
jgi:hypothetical protein